MPDDLAWNAQAKAAVPGQLGIAKSPERRSPALSQAFRPGNIFVRQVNRHRQQVGQTRRAAHRGGKMHEYLQCRQRQG